MPALRATIRTRTGEDRSVDAATPQAIGELVDALAETDAQDATIEAVGEETENERRALDSIVHDGFAYLRYRGPISGAPSIDEPVVSIGDPQSQEVRGSNDRVYAASTGLELPHFVEALHELSMTGELPKCVQWATERDMAAGNAVPLPRD